MSKPARCLRASSVRCSSLISMHPVPAPLDWNSVAVLLRSPSRSVSLSWLRDGSPSYIGLTLLLHFWSWLSALRGGSCVFRKD